jgi:hypothetical protein
MASKHRQQECFSSSTHPAATVEQRAELGVTAVFFERMPRHIFCTSCLLVDVLVICCMMMSGLIEMAVS